MAEAYVVRAVLEQAAAEAAAPFLKGNVASLRRTLAKVTAAALATDRDAYALHDLIFHRGIIEAAGNRILLQTWESLGFDTRTRIMLAWKRASTLPEYAPRPRPDPRTPSRRATALTAGRLCREHARVVPRPDRRAGRPGPGLIGGDQARSFVTTSPATSVRRKSRPWNRWVSRVWSNPSRWRIVAWRSWTWTRSSAALNPEVVGPPQGDPRLDPAAGQPHRERVGVMVPPVVSRPGPSASARTPRPR